MNPRQFYIFIILISTLSTKLNAQIDSINIEVQEVVEVKDSIKPKSKQGNLFIGIDLFNPIVASFTDKKGGLGMISYRIYKKWHLVAEVGVEKNHYDELDWKIDVDGYYYKIGFNWFISQDYSDPNNGFYTGFRFASANYNQTIHAYPIRNSQSHLIGFGSLPTAKVSAYWIEFLGGGRVKLLADLYADISVRPEIYVGSKKQDGIDPLVIPGYGRDVGPINFSIFWGLTYKLF